MSFASFGFVCFAPLFFLGWWIARRYPKGRDIYLLVASLVFYGYLEPRYVPIFLVSGTSSWLFGQWLAKDKRKQILVAAISVDLLILTFFKYSPFLADQLTALGLHLPKHHFPLPIGISFYTFMSIAYLVDVYKGVLEPRKDPWRYLAYLSMWPHLVAGPIVRPGELLPQMDREPNPKGFEGARLIVRGFFKKLVLADNIAPGVNLAFASQVPNAEAGYWWITAALFGLQIYFDFSGYTDIARGMARWIGYEFPLNFDSPYVAHGFGDFWRRWHISLSTWFRDYIYIPLGGSKKKPFRNLWITFLLSGLWHGAAWTFVAWGGLHALYLTVERLTGWHTKVRSKALVVAVTFLLVTLAWVFFRAESLSQAGQIIVKMARIDKLRPEGIRAVGAGSLMWGLAALAFVWFESAWRNRRPYAVNVWSKIEMVALVVAIVLAVYWRGPGSGFIYFQF